MDCHLPEVFYGGARGGGKTDGVLGKLAVKAIRYGRGFNALFMRRELPMLDDAIERSFELYTPVGARWKQQTKTWRFPNGARLRFRPLERLADAEKYKGQNVSDCVIEEAGDYPDPKPIDRLQGVLRSARGVPTQMLLTGNPGGPGQLWIKARYVDPAPRGMVVHKRRLPNKSIHRYIFIPARVQDNRLLLRNDPDYINRLYLVGSDELVKAWLLGDWNALEGAYFDCWATAKHVLRPAALPSHWTRFRSFDHGSYRPFSVGWWAVASEDWLHPDTIPIPKGALIRYREWYGCRRTPSGELEPNTGIKLPAEAICSGIREREAEDEKIHYSVADPSIFSSDGGPSIAARFMAPHVDKSIGIVWGRADNTRLGDGKGHLGGWDQLRSRLIGQNGRPMIYCFATCADSVRTLPALEHDATRPEDVDTDSEDHAADEWRYACMSRPYTRARPPTKGDIAAMPTFDELTDWTERSMRRRKRI